MPRNLFTGDGDEPVETPEGEPSPPSEIPVENLGGLYEVHECHAGGLGPCRAQCCPLKEARTRLNRQCSPSHPGTSDDLIIGFIKEEDESWFNNLRRRSLEGRSDPSRWERG